MTDEHKALAILAALANGINPTTGEVFAADGPYQAPDVIRALFCAIRALEAGAQRRPRRQQLHANAGKPWEESEDRRLLAGFDSGAAIAALAQAHGRTPGGIRVRLERYGRIEPQAQPRYRPRGPLEAADGAAPLAESVSRLPAGEGATPQSGPSVPSGPSVLAGGRGLSA